MGQVIKRFGAVIISVVAALAIFSLLYTGIQSPGGGTGILDALKEAVGLYEDEATTQQSQESIGDVYDSTVPDPGVQLSSYNNNVAYRAEDLFATSSGINVILISIYDMEGNDLTDTLYNEETQQVTFQERGTYRVLTRVTAENGKRDMNWYYININ